MIIHCTHKLAKKFPSVSATVLTETSPVGSWHANLYNIDSRNCVLLCHDKTRFTLFLAGLKKIDFDRFDVWFRDVFANVMFKLDYPPELIEKTMSLVDPLQFDTVCDRSVQGSLRTAHYQNLEPLLEDFPNVMDLPIYSASARMCHRPVTIKGMRKYECLRPDETMLEFIQTL